MEEEIAIINKNTRNEKIKNFFIKNKILLILSISLIIVLLIIYFVFNIYNDKKKVEISDLYNSAIIKYSKTNKQATLNILTNLVKKKDKTYSPLSLYFIIDNELTVDQIKVNELFDILINETSLDNEIKNLIIYKKGLFNADTSSENELLNILNPIINSESIWKADALYLMAEFFYSKNEKQKSKEFFNMILTLEKANQDLKIEAQKRLKRDLSE